MSRLTRKFKKYLTSSFVGGDASLDTSFNHPERVANWFSVAKQKYQFFYGLATILKWKESEMKGLLKSLLLAAEKLSSEYKSNEQNYETILKIDSGDDMTEMKENMQEKVRENLNLSYQTRYSEIIQKKQAYELVIKNIVDRRWYIVNSLQEGGGQQIVDRIIKQAQKIYGYYRGEKYKPIREMLYGHIKTIANSPSSYQNTFVLNASITGPAGSGKTTLARQMGSWFAKLGILTYDSFFRDEKDKLSLMETGRSDLIAEYTGQTAPKTLGVLARSLERTLFIDEAYSVAGCAFKDDDKLEADPYGEEFLAELLRFMNDHKGFNSLIVAGYENLMNKCFFARNEGLPRRFPQQIRLPFYSTDELYGIFAKNVALKRLTEIEMLLDYNKKLKVDLENKLSNKSECPETVQITDAIGELSTYIGNITQRKKELSMAIYWYLAVMKPSFMMIHYDTSYDARNTLRKYLTVLKLRHGTGMEKIYSWTILNHVFTNLLQDDTRKQLFRRKFYEEVFHFVEPNLSYFPAQAGEMENLSDDCAKQLAPLMAFDKTQVTVEDEKKVINDYCLGKKIKVHVGETPTKIISASLGGTKTEREKKDNEELLRILLDDFRERYKEDPAEYVEQGGVIKKKNTQAPVSGLTLNGAAGFATHKSQALKRINDLKAKLLSGAVVTASENMINIGGTMPEDQIMYELNMIGTEPDQIRRRIHDFLELDELFKGGVIPSLTELWKILNGDGADAVGKRSKIIKHVVGLYTKKISSDYIEEQLGESEKRFPIHLSRQLLETENEIFKMKAEHAVNCAQGEPASGANDKFIAQFKWGRIVCDMSAALIINVAMWNNSTADENMYAHPSYSLTVNDITKKDILYEDFGISYID